MSNDVKEYKLCEGCYIWQYDSALKTPVIYIQSVVDKNCRKGEIEMTAIVRVSLSDLEKCVKDMMRNANMKEVKE